MTPVGATWHLTPMGTLSEHVCTPNLSQVVTVARDTAAM